MDPFGNVKELSRRIDNHSLGGNTQRIGQGYQGLEYFSDTATRGSAVNVDDAKAVELSSSAQKFNSRLRRHVNRVLIECHRRVVDFHKHVGCYSLRAAVERLSVAAIFVSV